MAVKDGLPATDFSRMNREYIKAVAEGGSGGGIFVINSSVIPDDPNENLIMDKTWKEIADAMAAGYVCYVMTVDNTETTVVIEGYPLGTVTSNGEGSYAVADLNGTTYTASGENSYPQTEFE